MENLLPGRECQLALDNWNCQRRPKYCATFGKLIQMIDNAQVVGSDGEAFPKGLVISAWEHQVTECGNIDPESRNWIDVATHVL